MLSHFPDFTQKDSGPKILMRSLIPGGLDLFFVLFFLGGGVRVAGQKKNNKKKSKIIHAKRKKIK